MPNQSRNVKREEAQGVRLNSLGVDAASLEALLEMMDRTPSESEDVKMKRTYVRWPFACPTVDLKLYPQGGMSSSIRVVGRNLSASGIGLLHTNFVYPDTPCAVVLENNSGAPSRLEGKVVRCRHHAGVVHELGVRFAREVDPSEYIPENKIGVGVQLESIDPSNLRGHMLLIFSNELDQQLISHHLDGTQIRLDKASNFADGLEKAKSGKHDLILCDLMLEDGKSGIELIKELRASNPGAAVLVLSADGSSGVQREIEEAKGNGLLTKPMTRDSLIQGITVYLTVGFCGGSDQLRTSLEEDDERLAMLPAFMDDLRTKAKSLRELVSKDDAMGLYGLSLQIGGVAPTFGYEHLAMAARAASNSLAATMSVEESIKQIRALIDTCERVEA